MERWKRKRDAPLVYYNGRDCIYEIFITQNHLLGCRHGIFTSHTHTQLMYTGITFHMSAVVAKCIHTTPIDITTLLLG